jgi:hypothetical protein
MGCNLLTTHGFLCHTTKFCILCAKYIHTQYSHTGATDNRDQLTVNNLMLIMCVEKH